MAAAQTASRGIEACNKMALHFTEVNNRLVALKELQSINDIPWPDLGLKDILKKIADTRQNFILSLAQSGTVIASKPRSELLPDYFGQSFSILNEECFSSILLGDDSFFEKLFPQYFVCALLAHERLRTDKDVIQSEAQTRFVFSTEPLEDLLTVSGYALIFTELTGQKCWDIVRTTWESYLKEQAEPKAANGKESAGKVLNMPNVLSKLMGIRDSIFGLMPRDVARGTWKMNLERCLREKGLQSTFGFYSGAPRIAHQSPIIRVLSRGDHIFYEPRDIFLSVFLGKHSLAKGMELPSKAVQFLNALNREVERGKKAEDES